MTQRANEPDVLRDVWGSADDHDVPADDCSPTRVCRNARDFTFDGIAEDGEDLATAWRRLLDEEGKRSSAGSSLGDLVLGRDD